jgi:hypothetical protein
LGNFTVISYIFVASIAIATSGFVKQWQGIVSLKNRAISIVTYITFTHETVFKSTAICRCSPHFNKITLKGQDIEQVMHLYTKFYVD